MSQRRLYMGALYRICAVNLCQAEANLPGEHSLVSLLDTSLRKSFQVHVRTLARVY